MLWRSGLHLLQHRLHLGVEEIDGLQRADHHLELDDLACVVAGEDVDAVDVLALELGFELEDGVVARDGLLESGHRHGGTGFLL